MSTRPMTLSKARSKVSRKSLVFLAPFLGLLYDAICHVYAFVFYYFQTPFFATFIVVPLLGALAVWRGGRVGYAIATAISALFFFIEGGMGTSEWSSVTVTNVFVIYITVVPALFLALVYSVLGLKQVFSKPVISQKPSKMIPARSFLALLAIGFILGGATIGFIAAPVELRLAQANPLVTADIVIVQGASNSNNGQFYSPSIYNVTVGMTVTWVNHDSATHTVTEDNGLFDSGPIPPSGSFSYTFTKAGMYQYACTYHPWMTGTVIVNPG
jgi:plastocyanin